MMSSLRRAARVVLAVLMLALTLTVPAATAQAQTVPMVPMVPMVPGVPDCKGDPPTPLPPAGTLGSSSAPPPILYMADPFEDPDVPIHAVYGWRYSLITYDNGCSPGADLLPKAATEISTIGMEILGMEASAGHAMHSAVLNPMWLKPIDDAVESGVEAVRQATWLPWLSLAVIIVAVLMLWAARTGRLDSTVTTGVWALLVLGMVSLITTYPVQTTKAVDGVVQGSANLIVSSFADPVEPPAEPIGPGNPPEPPTGSGDLALDAETPSAAFPLPEPPADPELQAMVDQQWDTLMRNTAYEAWLKATFGSAETQTAAEYGPRIFKATHLGWWEWWLSDLMPGDSFYEAVIEAKQDDFVEAAEELSEEDPLAYQHMTGNKWGSRIAAVGMGLVAATLAMLFLVIAGIGMFIGFVIIRVAAFFSPAAGVIFLVERTRNLAIGFVQKIGKYVVMGPIFLLAGMVVLRINSAIAGSTGAWWLRIILLLVVSYVAWVLTRPASSIPGMGAAGKMMRMAVATATGVRLGRAGSKDKDGGDESPKQDPEETPPADPPVYQPPRTRPHLALDRSRAPRALPPGDIPRDRDQGQVPDEVPEYTAVPAESGRTFTPRAGMSARRVRALSTGRGEQQAPRALTPSNVITPGRESPGDEDQSRGTRRDGGPSDNAPVKGGMAAAAALTVNGTERPTGRDTEAGQERPGERGVTAGPVAGGIAALTVREREIEPGASDQGTEGHDGSAQAPVAGGTVLVSREPAEQDADSGESTHAAGTGTPAGPVGVVTVQRQPDRQPEPTESEQGVAGGVVASGEELRGRWAAGGSGVEPSPEEVAARARHEGTAREVLVEGTVVPEHTEIEVHEANITYDNDGRPVFTVYRPGGRSVERDA